MSSSANRTARAREPVMNGNRLLPESGPLTQEPDDTEAVWKSYNLLTLDGGGIRGYWSLLVLNKLMECVEDCERDYENVDSPAMHSFHPEDYPAYVSQVDRKPGEPAATHTLDPSRVDGNLDTLKASRRYLPCHYFDYIGGTSTGGLIAIMLGQLRMTVLDCIAEYETLGNEIFGKHRRLWQMRQVLFNHTKYDSRVLQSVFEDVSRRRSPQPLQDIRFNSKSRLCKTFVTTFSKEVKEGTYTRRLYLIRSYHYNARPTEPREQGPPRRTTFRSARTNTDATSVRRQEIGRRPINTGPVLDLHLWQVARAATAAPMFFEPLRLPMHGRDIVFEDGGFGQSNNPTMEGIKDIHGRQGEHALGAVVSIGTARHPLETDQKNFFARSKGFISDVTDPETIHLEVCALSAELHFDYWRLNPDRDRHLLNMDFDEWKPKRGENGRDSGSATLEKIKSSFSAWFSDDARVARMFQECAQELVARRRKRAQTLGKWERYAVGAEHRCTMPECPLQDRTFSNREDFCEHNRREHAIREERLNELVRDSRAMWQYRSANKEKGTARRTRRA